MTVIDQHRVGHGVTGHTTAKLSSLHQLVYAQFAGRSAPRAPERTRRPTRPGSRRIADLVDELPIECDLPPPAQLHLRRLGRRPRGDRGRGGGRILGGPDASFASPRCRSPSPPRARSGSTTRPSSTRQKFLVGAGRRRSRAAARGSSSDTRALACATELPVQVRDHRRRDHGGPRRGGHALPVPRPRAVLRPRARGALLLRRGAARPATPPEGMFISASSPTRSMRFHPVGGQELLIVGGEGHKVGQGGPTSPRYEALEEFAREHFDVGEIAYRWSAQDNYSADGAPLVGRLTPRSRGSYIGHGLPQVGARHGRGGGGDAHRRDRRAGQPLAGLLRLESPARPSSSAKALVTENANVGFHFFADRVTRRSADSADDLAPGEGKVVVAAWPPGGDLPRRRRRRARRLGPLHPPRLHRRLERRRADLGLPLPRLAIRPGRVGAPGPRGASAGGAAAALRIDTWPSPRATAHGPVPPPAGQHRQLARCLDDGHCGQEHPERASHRRRLELRRSAWPHRNDAEGSAEYRWAASS